MSSISLSFFFKSEKQCAPWTAMLWQSRSECDHLYISTALTLVFSKLKEKLKEKGVLPCCQYVCSQDSLMVEHRTRDWKVASLNPGNSTRRIFFSRCSLCVLTLIQCLFHTCVTAVACKRLWSFCQKCRWQITPKHAYTLDQMKSKHADYAVQA